jgi:hypothetical protein
LLQFLQPATDAFIWPADDVYAGDFVWSFLLEFV